MRTLSRETARNASTALCLVLTIALGVWLRSQNLHEKVFWYDEVNTLYMIHGLSWADWWQDVQAEGIVEKDRVLEFNRLSADLGVASTLSVLARNDGAQGPLYYLLPHILTAFVPPADVVLTRVTRWVSFGFGVLCIPLAAWLAWCWLHSRLAALLFSFFLAVSPFFVQYSTEARPYSLWSFLLLGLALLWLEWTRKQSLFPGAGFSAVFALALYSNPLTILLLPPLLLWGWCRRGVLSTRFRKAYVISLGASLMCLTPWAVVFLSRLPEIKKQNHFSFEPRPWGQLAYHWLDYIVSGFSSFRFFYQGVWLWVSVALVVTFLLVGLGQYCLRARDSEKWFPALWAVCFFGGLVAMDIGFGGIKSNVTRYGVPFYVFLFLTLAAGYARALRNLRTGSAASGLALALLLGTSAISISSSWRLRDPDYGKPQPFSYRRVAQLLDESPRPLFCNEREKREVAGIALHAKGPVSFVLGQPVSFLPPGYSHYFFLNPSAPLLTVANQSLAQLTVHSLADNYKLYVFVPR